MTETPMDLADVRAAAEKLEAIAKAGLIRQLRQDLAEACASTGGYCDGKRYWPIESSKVTRADHERQETLRGNRLPPPVVGHLTEFLGVSRQQATIAAIDLHHRGRRAVALELIEQYYRTARTQLRRRTA